MAQNGTLPFRLTLFCCVFSPKRARGLAVRCRSRTPLVSVFARLDRVEYAIQTPAHLRDLSRVAAPMCAVEIPQQGKRQSRILEQHGANARCVIGRRACPLDHAAPAVLSHDGRERLESAREW